jgi:hypothetical protein
MKLRKPNSKPLIRTRTISNRANHAAMKPHLTACTPILQSGSTGNFVAQATGGWAK